MFKKNWRTLLFLSALLGQLLILATFLASAGQQVWEMRGISNKQKSAMMTWTKDFSEYIVFLNDLIPEDAKVILPPNDSGLPLDNIGYMQHLLFPRDVQNCGKDEVEQCVLRVKGSNTYILADSNFPPRELAELNKTYIKFSDGYGVYVPKK